MIPRAAGGSVLAVRILGTDQCFWLSPQPTCSISSGNSSRRLLLAYRSTTCLRYLSLLSHALSLPSYKTYPLRLCMRKFFGGSPGPGINGIYLSINAGEDTKNRPNLECDYVGDPSANDGKSRLND
jgi:hypothetical protein